MKNGWIWGGTKSLNYLCLYLICNPLGRSPKLVRRFGLMKVTLYGVNCYLRRKPKAGEIVGDYWRITWYEVGNHDVSCYQGRMLIRLSNTPRTFGFTYGSLLFKAGYFGTKQRYISMPAREAPPLLEDEPIRLLFHHQRWQILLSITWNFVHVPWFASKTIPGLWKTCWNLYSHHFIMWSFCCHSCYHQHHGMDKLGQQSLLHSV